MKFDLYVYYLLHKNGSTEKVRPHELVKELNIHEN